MEAAVHSFRGSPRERLRAFIERPSTQRAIITLILINAARNADLACSHAGGG